MGLETLESEKAWIQTPVLRQWNNLLFKSIEILKSEGRNWQLLWLDSHRTFFCGYEFYLNEKSSAGHQYVAVTGPFSESPNGSWSCTKVQKNDWTETNENEHEVSEMALLTVEVALTDTRNMYTKITLDWSRLRPPIDSRFRRISLVSSTNVLFTIIASFPERRRRRG